MGLFDKLSGPPSKDKFAKMFMAGVRAAGELKQIHYDREQFSVVGEGGQISFLGNIYQEYCSVPKSQRAKVLQRSVRAWFVYLRELPKKFEDVHPDLLPAVRSRSFFELNRLRNEVEGEKPLDWPYQVLGEHFGVGMVYDMPDSMRSIPQHDLDAWGVTFYEALEAARKNLTGLQMAFIGPKEGEGVYMSAATDSHDASRIILVDLVRQFRVKGDYIAIIPNRNNLIVGGSEDLDSLKGMVKLAQKALKEPRPISGIALKLEGDDWVPWLPEACHPLYREFKAMQMQWLGQDYAEQKALLDKLHEKTGKDIFVVNYTFFEKKDTGEARSYAVWAEGVTDAYLPEVDIIAFVPNEGEPMMVDWDRAIHVVPGMMEHLDMYPVRFRVTGFPNADQLKAMGAATL